MQEKELIDRLKQHRTVLKAMIQQLGELIQMSKEESGKIEYWIYPGQRRPVVVGARNAEEAQKLVVASPEYDGFGSDVYLVDQFAKMCKDGTAP